MSVEQNKAIVRRVIEESWNHGKIAVHDEISAPTYIHHDPSFPNIRTRDDYKAWVLQLRSAIPDLHLTIDDLIAEGDEVSVRWSLQGTNTNDMTTPLHVRAAGKRVAFTGVTLIRFAGEKVVEDWHFGDNLTFMQQLGVIPIPQAVGR